MSKGRILLVEPDEEFSRLLNTCLAHWGYETTSVKHGSDAIKKTGQIMPHLLILALDLHDITGSDVCTKLRRTPLTRHIPIIFLAQHGKRYNKIFNSFDLGGDDYIEKPFDTEEVKLRVANQLAMQKRSRTVNMLSALPSDSWQEEQLKYLQQRNTRFTYIDLEIRNLELKQEQLLKRLVSILLYILDLDKHESDFLAHLESGHIAFISERENCLSVLAMMLQQINVLFEQEAKAENPLIELHYGVFVANEHPRDIDIREIVEIANEDRKKRFGEAKKPDDGIEREW